MFAYRGHSGKQTQRLTSRASVPLLGHAPRLLPLAQGEPVMLRVGRPGSASQAEYAGSIPVIGSTKPKVIGLAVRQSLNPCLSFDRLVTVVDTGSIS